MGENGRGGEGARERREGVVAEEYSHATRRGKARGGTGEGVERKGVASI